MSETHVNAYRLDLNEKKKQLNILKGELAALESIVKRHDSDDRVKPDLEPDVSVVRDVHPKKVGGDLDISLRKKEDTEKKPQPSKKDVKDHADKKLSQNGADNSQVKEAPQSDSSDKDEDSTKDTSKDHAKSASSSSKSKSDSVPKSAPLFQQNGKK